MHFSFQDYSTLYLVLDYLEGGNLRNHLIQKGKFTEDEIKFVLGCIIVALKYISSNGIVHRDIKPENLVFDSKGYLRLSDFGLAKMNKAANCSDTSGTPGYIAPEVVNGGTSSFSSDFYSVGVIGYELLTGKRPYAFQSKEDLKNALNKSYRGNCSEDFIDFIRGLLKVNSRRRLGAKGIEEIMSHPWFKNFDWDKLENKELPSPFEGIKLENNANTLISVKEKQTKETLKKYKKYMNNNEFMSMFFGYTFINYKVIQNYPKKNKKHVVTFSDQVKLSTRNKKETDTLPELSSRLNKEGRSKETLRKAYKRVQSYDFDRCLPKIPLCVPQKQLIISHIKNRKLHLVKKVRDVSMFDKQRFNKTNAFLKNEIIIN